MAVSSEGLSRTRKPAPRPVIVAIVLSRSLVDREQFDSGYVRMSINGVCDFCQMEFWKGIAVVCDSKEELDALQAVRLERRKPQASSRHGQEILEEIRSEAASKH